MIYVYQCQDKKCQRVKDINHLMNEKKTITCEYCKGEMKKIIELPTLIGFENGSSIR